MKKISLFARTAFLAVLVSPILWGRPALAVSVSSGPPKVSAIIAKCRAYLGPESALNAIDMIHYHGELKTSDGKSGTIDIIFKKPVFQRIVITVGHMRAISGVNQFDGWRKHEVIGDSHNWELYIMNPFQIRKLQATSMEALDFYRGVKNRDGWISYEGIAKADGVDCYKLGFYYSRKIYFIRYFAIATGRLVLTETDKGEQFRESGSIVVDGVRFPTKWVSRQHGRTATITFDKISVNEPVKTSIFDVPVAAPVSEN